MATQEKDTSIADDVIATKIRVKFEGLTLGKLKNFVAAARCLGMDDDDELGFLYVDPSAYEGKLALPPDMPGPDEPIGLTAKGTISNGLLLDYGRALDSMNL